MSGGGESDRGASGDPSPAVLADRTAALVGRARADRDDAADRFEAARSIAERLGAHPIRPEGADPATDPPEGVAFGFWTPDLVEAGVPVDDVRLELFVPASAEESGARDGESGRDDGGDPDGESGGAPLDPGRDDLREVAFRVDRLPVERDGEFHWIAVEGIPVGTRDRLGALYQLVYRAPDGDGEWETVRDPLARSVPFGAFAPAEAYDWPRLDATRPDRDHFASFGGGDEALPTTEDDGLPRVDPATSMLEIHPGTSTESGSLAALADRFETVGEKLRSGEELAPHERNYAGYDAVQLMPVEPLTQAYGRQWYWRPGGTYEPEAEGGAVDPASAFDRERDAERVTVGVERPDQSNWGYDIVVSAFSAANPAILETGRPDELVDFIAACHAMPDSIRVVFDVALGHADEAAAELLPDPFFEGPGMYGLHLDYRQPVVRAILLELQRRKANFGADGVRIDGAQDFTYHDEETGEQVHDDAFLAEMDRVTHEVAGTEYRPWMVYEDGRPWPREDWELASTYRTLIDQHPHAFQWSPVTFAHNKPALLTFWATKWWRMREVGETGSQWITGVANHDTLRRGSQVEVTDDWGGALINPYLADSPPETIREAYDSPAALVWFHVAMPGVPMDFLHANYRAPWGFVRDTDPTWNVKVVAEEAPWLDWHVPEETYAETDAFPRLKALGFDTRDELKGFVTALASLVDATDFDLDLIAELLSVRGTPLSTAEDDRRGEASVDAADLQAFSFAWSADVADYLVLDRWESEQGETRTAFDRRVREFRQARPWLRADVDPERGEAFGHRHPTEGTVVYQALRRDPDGDEALLVACNVEGTPVEASPAGVLDDLGVGDERSAGSERDGESTDWTVALAAPDADAEVGDDAGPVTLETADAIVWRAGPEAESGPAREREARDRPADTTLESVGSTEGPMRLDRSGGVFCHVTSLPGRHGIGDLGDGAEAFLSFLGDADVRHWQVCPLGPTMDAAGESPYQSPSAFAGNPLLIDLDGLVDNGWLDESDLEPVPDFPDDRVDYEAVRGYKEPLLRTAFERFEERSTADDRAAFDAFREREPWLDDYALFRALSDARDEDTWTEWPDPLRTREPEALADARERHATEVRYREFLQWTFDRQWRDLRAVADEEGVSIVGDVPIYVALDSADVWANPEAFRLDDGNRPAAVAGVPPNAGDTGQRWGNPVYDWDRLAERDYDWWIDRFRRLFELADVARLDHFLGFVKYWAIPADRDDPADGEWHEAPGRDLFETVERELGQAPFIAEDLGFEEPAMDELMAEFGFPGMRVPQYADWCGEGDEYQPMHYPEGVVGYTSTHDTDTWVGYFETLPERQRECFRYNVGAEGDRPVEWEIIDEVWASEAVLAMTTVQDLLGLGSESRFNEPGTLGGNWEWRVRRDALDDEIADRLWELAGDHVR